MNKNDKLDKMLENIYASESTRVFEFTRTDSSEDLHAEIIKVKKYRPLKVLMAAALVAALAIGAGAVISGNKGNENKKNTNLIENYFTENADFKADVESDSSLRELVISGDRLFYISEFYNNQENGTKFVVADLNGNIIKKEHVEYINDKTIRKIKAGEDNDIWILRAEECDYIKYKSYGYYTYRLEHYDSTGELKETLELDKSAGENTVFNPFFDFVIMEDGRIICINSNFICQFDKDGNITDSTKKLTDSDENEYWIQAAVNSSECSYLLAADESGNTAVLKIGDNLETVKKADLGPLRFQSNKSFSDGDEDYGFYVSLEGGIFGYNEESGNMKEIINWIDSDIDCIPEEYAMCGKDSIICGSVHWGNGQYESNEMCLFRIDRADDELLDEINSRNIITVACGSVPSGMVSKISEFNRSSEENRIKIIRYDAEGSDYDIYSDIMNSKNLDLIIDNGTLDMNMYSNIGKLADINELIDNDPDIKREDFFENIFEVYQRDGKQYQLPLFFDIKAMRGKKSVTGDDSSVSFRDLSDYSDKGNIILGQKEELVNELIKENISEFADFSELSCDFLNENFISLLKIIKKDMFKGSDEEYDDIRYKNERSGFEKYYMSLCKISPFTVYHTAHENNDDYMLKCYPSGDSEGMLAFSDFSVLIPEQSKNKEAAWSFVKMLLSEDFQTEPMNVMDIDKTYVFPVLKSAFDIRYERYNRKWTEYDDVYRKKIIDSVSRVVIRDKTVNLIIDEETEMYFEGEQSAEKTAENIQKKVEEYFKSMRKYYRTIGIK